MLKLPARMAIVATAAAMFWAVPASIEWSANTGPVISLDSAQARVGRPLTPLSGAGVVRRTTRRHVYGGTVVGAPVYGAPVYGAPACVRVLVRGVWVCG